MSISGNSDDGNNQNTMNSMNAMNGIMNNAPSTPGSINGKQSSNVAQMLAQNASNTEGGTPKPVIERGASWSYNETRILLSLWGQDMVQRQLTNSKRTRHVWEKIAEKIKEFGFQRSAEQVRTRVFNMIAEYRRILKNPTPERKKKCIFFDALHKIYQAKDANGVRQALNNYEEEYNLEPLEFSNMDDQNDTNNYNDHDNSDSGNEDKSEIFSYAMSPSHFNGVSMNMNGISNDHGSSDGQEDNDLNNAQPVYKRMRSETSNQANNLNNLTNHHNLPSFNNQQSNSFDIGSNLDNGSAILIDRMFSHLTKESEVMREWVVLERERLRQEMAKRKEDNDREERREKQFLNCIMKMQEQFLNHIARNQTVKDLSSLNLLGTNGQLANRSEHLNGLNDNGEYDDMN